MGELIHDPLQARTQLPLYKAACLQLELPVPDSRLGPTPSLRDYFRPVTLLQLTLAWKSLVSAASWILRYSDPAVVTGEK